MFSLFTFSHISHCPFADRWKPPSWIFSLWWVINVLDLVGVKIWLEFGCLVLCFSSVMKAAVVIIFYKESKYWQMKTLICWLHLWNLASQSEPKVAKQIGPSFMSRAEFYLANLCQASSTVHVSPVFVFLRLTFSQTNSQYNAVLLIAQIWLSNECRCSGGHLQMLLSWMEGEAVQT